MPEEDETQKLTENIESQLANYRKSKKGFKASDKIGTILIKAFKKDILTSLALSSISDLTSILNLYLSSFLLSWLRDEDAPAYQGYIFAFILGFLMFIAGWTRNYYLFIANKTGLNIRKGLSGVIYRKILRFNQKSKASASSGKLVSIVSGELQLVERGLVIIPALVTAPFTLAFTFIMLSFIFKEAVLFGLLVGIIIIAMEIVCSKMITKYRYKEGFHSDKRLKAISDIINGIRTIKAYAWEVPFMKLVSKHRSKMLSYTFKNQAAESSMWGIAGCGGYIVGIAIFGYHWGMGRTLHYEESLAGIAILGYASSIVFHQMFFAISFFSNFLAVLKRSAEVLDMEEFVDTRTIDTSESFNGKRINLKNLSSTWGFSVKKVTDEEGEDIKIEEDVLDTNLQSLNFTAGDGDLIAIVGQVGCGKSTFISVIMDELVTQSGEVSVNFIISM